MVNPERGGVEIKSADGRRTYIFRLGLAALAQLQQKLSTPERRMPLAEVIALLQDVLGGQKDKDIDLTIALQVLLVGFQEFHAGEVKTVYDVERVIESCGGIEGLARQLAALGVVESLAPDPEDIKRRAAHPRKARSRTN